MGSRYWELFGPVRTAVRNHLKVRTDKYREASAYFKSLGAGMASAESGLYVTLAAVFDGDPPDLKVWRRTPRSDDPFYLPRRSSKQGRALAEAIGKLERSFPTGDDVGRIIGLELFNGNQWRTPAAAARGKRVFVETPDDYEPPPKLQAHIKRVSDLTYERIVKREKLPHGG